MGVTSIADCTFITDGGAQSSNEIMADDLLWHLCLCQFHLDKFVYYFNNFKFVQNCICTKLVRCSVRQSLLFQISILSVSLDHQQRALLDYGMSYIFLKVWPTVLFKCIFLKSFFNPCLCIFWALSVYLWHCILCLSRWFTLLPGFLEKVEVRWFAERFKVWWFAERWEHNQMKSATSTHSKIWIQTKQWCQVK